MANEMRWRYGDTNPVVAAVDSATVVEIGDLVYLDTDDAKPAESFTWTTDLATTQGNFHDKFLGVAEQQSRSGDTDGIRVSADGVFEFDCAAASFEIGDLIGPAKATGNALESQKVVEVTTIDAAIGRVAKRYGSNTTKVLVRIFSRVMSPSSTVAATTTTGS